MENLNLSKIKKVFFIGIGGIGISALAKMALSRGMDVSGINDEEGKSIDALLEAGVKIIFQKELKDLPEADLYVYSDAWLYRGPEIIENAKKTGRLVMNYFDALGIFAKEYKVIAIAGTHGKTTTSAMVSGILIDAGLDPTCIVGSFVKKFNSNFRKGLPAGRQGKGSYMVVEADEYNRHFLSLAPFITVITNIEADHLDYYKNLADVEDAFRQLILQTGNNIVYNAKDTSSHVLVRGNSSNIVDYSKYLYKVPKLLVPGVHNQMNAAAALAVAIILKIPEAVAQKSLSEFSGTWRRLEKRGQTADGTIVYDDYAHHPTEIRASLQGLRELYPKDEHKITVLFQPHLFSRTKALFNDFAKSFKEADKILLLPIYFAREDPDPSISSEKLAEAIKKEGGDVGAFPDFETAEKFVKDLNLGPKDVFITMGAGEAYKVADQVLPLV